MDKSKKSIVIIAICALLVIGGGIGAAIILRNNNSGTVKAKKERKTSETEEVDYSEYEYEDYTYEEYNTDADGESSTEIDEDNVLSDVATTIKNGVKTTVKNVTNKVNSTKKSTKSTTKSSSKTTTKKNSATTKSSSKTTTTKSNTTKSIMQKAMDEDAEQSLLGYRWSSTGGPDGGGYYYCDDKDNWQRYTGYNEVYDKWAPLAAMQIDQIRIRFEYEDLIWMIQLWKGQYGFLLVGAECGVYNCDPDDYTGNTGDMNHFYCADEDNWLQMQLDCYFCQGGEGQYKRIFTRPYDYYWWATGFVKGQLTKYTAPRTELKTRNRITFKSVEMANLFVNGLKQSGFGRVSSKDGLLNDTYYQDGKDVYLLWYSKNHEAFVGLE